MHPNRLEALKSITEQTHAPITPPDARWKKTSEYYGELTFDAKAMQEHLPRESFAAVKRVIKESHKLDHQLAQAVAGAVKTWALSLGCTHFTHWFQPMTGLTAEKHDSFASFDDDGKIIEKFTAGQLIQSEPDASSFPSGGVRSTFEARGYTAWDVSSPMFIVEHAGTRVLCIPSVFVSYTGESLDTKTALLRSMDVLDKAAVELLHEMGDTKVTRVTSTVGAEQEYFLIDKKYVFQRPDLLLTGRTLLGGDMPKGQQLEDHYFGCIPARVQAFMADLERELYRLGVPVKTRHNEVAPSQFELAPIFEDSNLSSDHNMLTMDTAKRVAERHGLVCLLHEKPFAGVNGSGKHVNWSMSTDTDVNLLDPGLTPHANLRFLAFMASTLRAVFRNQVALRGAIASHGNDHRLGANEAPPAIISAFLGSTLTEVMNEIEAGKDPSQTPAEKAVIEFHINRLPTLPKDNTDRNRTSPFAFTGNKFEFRAVGSSHAISFPVAILNAAVTESVKEFAKRLKAKKSTAASVDSAVLAVVKEFITESKNIRFEGDGYSAEWKAEAKRRGLYELLNTPASLEAFAKPEHHKFLVDTGVYSATEVEGRIKVRLESFIKNLDIEAQTMITMVRQHVLPSAFAYQTRVGQAVAALKELDMGKSSAQKNHLRELAESIEEAIYGVDRLKEEVRQAHEMGDEWKAAHALASKVRTAMSDLRGHCDKLEAIVSDECWSLPKYREMLFIR